MGTSFFCPNAVKSKSEMIVCRLDRCLCDKQQYCPAKRMYENTAGVGNCKKRKEGTKQKESHPDEKGKQNGANTEA